MLRKIIIREIKRLGSRPMWLMAMVLVPMLTTLFFLSLLGPGLPLKVPSAIVDLDHTPLSRQITRSLNATELVNLVQSEESYADAVDAVQRGEIFGFFVIPDNFERDAIGGNSPTLTFYSNLTFYVPGTLVFKGFKTLGVTTAGNLAATTLVASGAPQQMAENLIQPMTVGTHPLHNPWLNYSYYLSSSFLPGLLELMIFIVTVYAIAGEIKTGSSRRLIEMASGDPARALLGKLAPHTAIFFIVGMAMNGLMFGFQHFPLNNSPWHMALAMLLFVIACQGFAAFVCCIIPNLRLALSVCCLLGILAFSVAAFSFPVQSMYGGIAIFSYILPVRHYFEIYIGQALNGIPFYYSRHFYASLLVFPILATLASPLLTKHMRHPVYVP